MAQLADNRPFYPLRVYHHYYHHDRETPKSSSLTMPAPLRSTLLPSMNPFSAGRNMGCEGIDHSTVDNLHIYNLSLSLSLSLSLFLLRGRIDQTRPKDNWIHNPFKFDCLFGYGVSTSARAWACACDTRFNMCIQLLQGRRTTGFRYGVTIME